MMEKFISIIVVLGIGLSAVAEHPLQSQTPSPLEPASKPAMTPVTQQNRVRPHADFRLTSQLPGQIPSWVTTAEKVGPVSPKTELHLTFLLSRAPKVEAAFDQLIADQQNPHSTRYHQWLTPDQSGILFGATQDDISALSRWLQSQGFTIDNIALNRIVVEVSAPASVVSAALATNFSYFNFPGEAESRGPHLSATSEPKIPTALIPLVEAISGLSYIPVHAMSERKQ